MNQRPSYEELEQRIKELEKENFEIKRVEEAIKESADRFRLVFERSNDAIIVHQTGEIKDVNERTCELTGYTREQLLNMSVLDLFSEEYQVAIKNRLKRCVRAGATVFETKWKRIDGELIDVEVNSGDFDPKEGIRFGITRDITERKKAEEALRESEKRYRMMFEYAGFRIQLFDAVTGERVEFNREAYEQLGYTREEFENFSISDIDVARSSKDLLEELAEITKKGSIKSETKIKAKSGEIRDMLISSVPIKIGGRDLIQSISVDITDRKRMDDALRKSEAFSLSILESSPTPILVINPDTSIRYVNPALEELTGYTFTELNGQKVPYPWWSDELDSGNIKDLNETIFRKIRGREKLFRKKNRETFWAEITSSPVTRNGELDYNLSTWVDTTERKNAEEALQRSETRYRKLFHDNLAVTFIRDPETERFLDVNPAACSFYGYSREEMLGMELTKITHGHLERIRRRSRETSTKGRNHFYARHFLANGEPRDVEIYNNSVVIEGKTLIYAVVHDITDRKQAEESLKWELKVNKTLAQLSGTLISSSQDMISIANLVLNFAKELTQGRHGYVSGVDPKTKDMVGHTLTEMMGDQCKIKGREITFPIGPDGKYNGLWGYSLNTLKPFYTNDRPNHPSSRGLPEGHIPIKNFLAVPVKIGEELVGQIALADTENEFTNKHLAVIEQLGELYAIAILQQRSEEEKTKLIEQLQQAQKMEAIGNLAGGIAHDFNNILLPILAHSEMALMELPTDSPVRQSIQHIYKAGERARDLVKQILTFARRRGEMRAPIRISPIVNEAIRFLRSTIPSTIEIRYHINTEQDTVLADPTQINQIVMNLCTNATHAMREKGGLLVISQVDKHIDTDETGQFGGLSPGQYLKLSVGDTGSGIDPDIIERIFEPYFTTKCPSEGTGMGLAVIHGIVKSYGGVITVDCEQGRGATFNILLPKIVADIAPCEDQTIEIPKGMERILFVDDEKAAVDAIRPMLEGLGYHVTARTSSIEALEAFRYKPDNFDLVITDQTMPNMTGKDLAKGLMSIRDDIPIILCTGFSEQIDESMSKELGINAFLMKPIVMLQLAQTIREVLDNK